MPLQLYDLPFDMLEMIGEFYDDLAQREAASTLQAALQRHLLTRCDDPRHTARTNTPGEGPVLCYQSCHNHPKRVFAAPRAPSTLRGSWRKRGKWGGLTLTHTLCNKPSNRADRLALGRADKT